MAYKVRGFTRNLDIPRRALIFLPLVFFAALLFSRLHNPEKLVFDEIHYIPAAKALATFSENINWVHPPLGKWIMGFGWYILTFKLGLLSEPAVFRFISVLFGLWALWAVRAWMIELRFSERNAQAAVWMTGFNFIWFVQSKTAMLDMFYIAFALWGLLDIFRNERNGLKYHFKFWRGWVLLGLGMSAKWSTLPFILLAFFLCYPFSLKKFFKFCIGGALSVFIYFLTYVPLAFLEKNPVKVTDFFRYHKVMLDGFKSINSANHPYLSHWWEWPTLMRPMWYAFESSPNGEQGVWAGGNPVLYWSVLPFLILIVVSAIRSLKRKPGIAQNFYPTHLDQAARVLTLLYWVPLLFWAVTPRKLQMYYYYLAPSFFAAPILVWAHEKFYVSRRSFVQNLGLFMGPRGKPKKGYILLGLVLLCAVAFIYFLPIMDGRLLRPGRYLSYMWFRRWI